MLVRRIRAIAALSSTIMGLFFIARTLRSHQQDMRSSKNPQYFKDVSFHSQTHLFGASNHVDSRFAPQSELSIAETRQACMDLLCSFSEFMNSIDAIFWVAHGSLLGWYWNEQLLPWDTDVDFQVSDSTLEYLAGFYNMTFYLSARKPNQTYLLDVNPFFRDTSVTDRANTIDARWIDVENGKFVDITAVHSVGDRSPSTDELFCKDGHRYEITDIYPLVPARLAGVNMKVPYDSLKILQQEYGKRALRNTHFHWHIFNETSKQWEAERAH